MTKIRNIRFSVQLSVITHSLYTFIYFIVENKYSTLLILLGIFFFVDSTAHIQLI